MPDFCASCGEAKPVGLLWMHDEAGSDAKLICVPPTEPRWKGVEDLPDLPAQLMEEIKHFFDVYKALEPDKESHTGGFEGRETAWKVIGAARAKYLANDPTPMP